MFRVPLAIAAGTVTSTSCYLAIGRAGVDVVDSGEDSAENRRRLADALARCGRSMSDVRSIVVTHLHPDHLGMADHLRLRSSGEIVLHRAEVDAMAARYGGTDPGRLLAWGVPAERRPELAAVHEDRAARTIVDVDRVVEDGQELALGDHRGVVLWTPGHTPGSICIALETERLVLTGDHVLPDMQPGLGLGGPTVGNALVDYLRSLERLERYRDCIGLPGHGGPFALVERARRTAEHHRARTTELADAVDRLPGASIWELAAAIRWRAGWDALHGYALDAALTQTELHVGVVRSENR